MKGFNDLKTLEFGTVIYDARGLFEGERGVVGTLDEENNTVQVLWESCGVISYDVTNESLTFSLEKPKKKVVKELKGYIYLSLLEEAHKLTGRRNNSLLFSKELVDDTDDTLVTITYEVEE